MRFLICSLNYAPDLIGISKYTTEMAEWLAARGHDVAVVTAPPYYPDWKIGEGYRAWVYRHERINGVRVYRVPLYVPKNPSGTKRLIHLLSFALSAFPLLLWLALSFRPQLLFSVAPPLFAAPFARLAARLCGARSWLHVQDFEVDAAFELGLLKGRTIRSIALGWEKSLLSSFHQVSSISANMALLAARKAKLAMPVFELRNWVDTRSIHPLEGSNLYRVNLKLGADDILVLYSGNISHKQGMDVLVAAAARLQDRKHIHFLIAGEGPGKDPLRDAVKGMANIHLLPLQPQEFLNSLLNAADIHVLPQSAQAADLVLPSKLTGMQASGRPVVATAAPGTGIAQEIQSCGILVPPADAEALAAAIIKLADDSALRKALGQAARAYAEIHLARDAVLGAFEERCYRLVEPERHEPAPQETESARKSITENA